jgi:phage terminase large subunit-like protein
MSATLLRPQTNHGLSEARFVVAPKHIASSGLPAVKATCERIGLGFDPWQTATARLILAKDVTGLYAADTAVLSIPRQVGKTYLIGALVFADCIINPGTTTVWTAHRFKVARETFNSLKGIACSALLAPHIDPDAITTAAGNECIPFRNGSRIVFAARERGAIRGFAKVRRLVLDECQILSDAAMADLAPTMNQAVNPQIILTGTPPKPTDPGEVFANLRSEAIGGKSDDVVYIEFSAAPDAHPDDRRAWREANPSYPSRTPAKAILRMRRLLSEADFAREALGIWDDASRRMVIPIGLWNDCADTESTFDGAPVLAFDVSPDLRSAAICAAGTRSDGMAHLEVVRHLPGTEWLPGELARIAARHGVASVVANDMPHVLSLVPTVEAAGVSVQTVGKAEFSTGCGGLLKAVTEGTVRHLGDPILTTALTGAARAEVGDGAWAWARKRSEVDISPLVAVTLASWALASVPTFVPLVAYR